MTVADDGDVRVPGGSSGWVGVNGFVNETQRDGPGGETSRDRRRWPARVGRGQDGPGETVRDAGGRGSYVS
jgi:hypothetical protein